MTHFPTAYGYAQRAGEDVTAVRQIINSAWGSRREWDADTIDEIRDYLGDAMGAIVAVADECGITL